jgi:hypothetical protein
LAGGTQVRDDYLMAGYSETPLLKKLGIKQTTAVRIIGTSPPGVEVPGSVSSLECGSVRVDVVLAFVTTEAEFVAGLEAWGRMVFPAGGLWVCWPKKAARKKPQFAFVDMTEDTVREHALPLGLVDNKVCAIDDDWSGLRLVWRVELRK